MKQSLIVVLPLVLLAVSPAAAETRWRVSDAEGRDRGDAPAGPRDQGWLLQQDPEEGGSNETLYHDGQRVLWRRLRAGQPVWSTRFDPVTGSVVSEAAYDRGQKASTLRWDGGDRPYRRVETAPDGTTLSDDLLRRAPDGRLTRLERASSLGPAAAAWSYDPAGALAVAWSQGADERQQGLHREWIYGQDGTRELLLRGTDILESRLRTAAARGQGTETRSEPDGITLLRVTDARGRPVEETRRRGEQTVEVRRWTYDSQGRVIEQRVDSPSGTELRTWEYRANDAVLERWLRSGVVQREEMRIGGEKTEVRLYDRGELFLVETWTGGRKTGEAYYAGGILVREKRG